MKLIAGLSNNTHRPTSIRLLRMPSCMLWSNLPKTARGEKLLAYSFHDSRAAASIASANDQHRPRTERPDVGNKQKTGSILFAVCVGQSQSTQTGPASPTES